MSALRSRDWRKAAREALATLGKASIAMAVFSAIMLGWQFVQLRQAQAFANSLPLPNETVQDGCAVWFVGSSSMSRWTSLQDDMRPWTTHNRSLAGATLEEISARFGNEAQPQRPQAIVFYAGENDLAFGISPEKTTSRFADFLRRKTEKLGATPVFFISVKPSPTRWAMSPAQERYNAAVRAMAAGRTDLHYVDTRAQFLKHGRPGPFYGPDGLHLNEDGYRIFTQAVHRALDRQLPAELIRHCRRMPGRV